MRKLFLLLLFPLLIQAKVYDCFLFYNELEILEIRFAEMEKEVDFFVVVEASETFRGKPKELVFEKNRERFEKYKDKIIYVPVKRVYRTEDPWKREEYQREQILQGLKGCKEDDIILISDVDEIVRPGTLPQKIGKREFCVFEQTMYVGFLNRMHGPWMGTVALPYKDLQRIGVKKARKLRTLRGRSRKKMGNHFVVKNGGWHFSSMGGIKKYIQKLESFSHAEYDTPENKTLKAIQANIETNTLVPIDSSYPRYVVENEEKLRQAGFIEESGTGAHAGTKENKA